MKFIIKIEIETVKKYTIRTLTGFLRYRLPFKKLKIDITEVED